MSDQQLHAEWDAYNYTEIATALLRGVGSNVEYRIKNQNTPSAHFKRTLISGLRIAHDILLIKNHPTDYHCRYFGDNWLINAYCDGSLMVDSLDGIVNLFALAESIINQDDTFGSAQEFFSQLPIKNRTKPSIEFIQKYMLPMCESSAALYLAVSDDRIVQNQKKRFIARTMLSLSRSLHNLLEQQTREAKFTTSLFIVVQIVYAGYQILNDDSDFNTWLAMKKNAEPKPIKPAKRKKLLKLRNQER